MIMTHFKGFEFFKEKILENGGIFMQSWMQNFRIIIFKFDFCLKTAVSDHKVKSINKGVRVSFFYHIFHDFYVGFKFAP